VTGEPVPHIVRPRLAALALAGLFAVALGAPAAAADATVASTLDVALRDIPQAAPTEGVVEAVRQSTLAAQVAGRVVELAVKAGDTVRAGQLLVRIDARTADQAVAASLSQVAEAEANLANAKRKYERNRDLVAQKFVSQAALDQAEAEYKAAQAQVAALKAGAVQASAQQSYTTITAPYAGVVGATSVEVGDMATPGRELVTVFDPRELRVVATVPQATLTLWKRDLPIVVEVPALRKALTPTRVTVIPLADARTHTVRVRLDLPPTEGMLPGQFARASFPVGTVRAIAVPASALVRRGELTAVYVVGADGRPLLRQVRTGETHANGPAGPLVEILSGLAAGERIAANPVQAGLGTARATAK
jgi:RND family efflux transporter MFP subunit